MQSWESGCGSGNLLGPSLDLAAAIMKVSHVCIALHHTFARGVQQLEAFPQPLCVAHAVPMRASEWDTFPFPALLQAHAYLSCGKAYPGWMTQAQQRDAGAGAAGGSELEGRGSAAAAAGSMQAAGGSELEARGSAAAAAGSMQATDGSGQAAVGSGQVAGTSRPVASGSSPAAGRKRRGDAAAMVRSSTRSAAQDGHFAAQLEQPAAASTPAQAAKRPRLQQPGPSEGGTTLSVAAGAAAGAGPTAAAGAAAAAAGKCQAAAGSSSSFMDQLEAATEEAAAAASGLTPELADAFAKLARPDVVGPYC